MYVASLVLLLATAWLALTGTQVIQNVGDLARFSGILFQVLAPLQLALVIFFSAVLTASSVSQEKDRQTLILLLMTDLKNHELVLGKLLASLLHVLVLLAAALPLFMGLVLLGGVEVTQVVRTFAVTLVAALLAGSLGALVALWREKTFQTLAMTVLVLVAYLALGEVVAWRPESIGLNISNPEQWAAVFSPWRAVLEATRPMIHSASSEAGHADPVLRFLMFGTFMAALLSTIAIVRVRVWNPSRELRSDRQSWTVEHSSDVALDGEGAVGEAPAIKETAAAVSKQRTRNVWKNPVAWREVRTWAYGRKVVAIRLVYVLLAGAAAAMLLSNSATSPQQGLLVMVPLFLISLVLVNAQAVTALSTERDGKTLDLLLVTDLLPREFILGKLAGIFYNTKEMVLLPILVCLALCWQGTMSAENTAYVVGGLLVMNVFVAVLGVHCGLIHENSRIAVGTSLGTVFFLFVGVALCMRIMVSFPGSFASQLPAFLTMILGGGVALYVSLGARNASTAILVAAFTCPFLTFWAITSFLQDYTAGVFLVTVCTYGFATAAMLVPAISEFAVATGRSASGE